MNRRQFLYTATAAATGMVFAGCDSAKPERRIQQENPAEQQVQEDGFASAVSTGEPELPVCIYLKTYIFENIIIAAVVGKCEI